MGLDDRAADRQPHSNTLRLGGEEWFKDTVCLFRIESSSRILNLDQHGISVPRRFYEKLPWPVSEGTHCFDAVDDQVDQDLLQLYSVAEYARQISGKVELYRDMASGRLMTHKNGDFVNHIIDVQFNPIRSILLQQRTNPRNDVAGSGSRHSQSRQLLPATPPGSESHLRLGGVQKCRC